MFVSLSRICCKLYLNTLNQIMYGVFMRSKTNSGIQFSMMFPVLVALSVALSNIASALSSPTLPRSTCTYVVVVIGERVEMNCNITGNDSASWTYSWKTSTEESIYLGKDIVASMRSRYKIEKGFSGQYNLIIESVDLNHAGRYRCTATMQQSMINDVQLTVLGAEPGCAANTSETHDNGLEHPRLQFSMWCSINYTGDGFPVFNWSKNNNETDIAANRTTSVTSRRSVAYTSLIMQQLTPNDNGVTFQCNIVFMMPNYFESGYVNPWKFTLYGPKNLSIVRHEDCLNCSADGNPIPTYRWTHIETNTVTYGSFLALNGTFSSDKDHYNTFQCTAANIFATETMNITIEGAAEDAGVTKGVPITIVAIGGLLLLLLIIAILVSCIVHRKRLKDNAPVNIMSPKPSQGLTSKPPIYENTEVKSSDTGDNYCSLMDGLTASCEPQVYCELRSYEQQGINRPSTKEKTEIEYRVYANASQL